MSRQVNYERTMAIPQIRRVGRPHRWENVEDLEAEIQSYFDSCFEQRFRQVKTKNGEEEEYIDEPILDREGNPTYTQIRPFTVTGLAVHLGTTRQRLLDYENNEERPEFRDAIKNAKQIIENYSDEALYRQSQVAGVIFSLKNNFKWIDRTETDITSKNEKIMPGVIETKAADILEEDNASE